MLYNDADCAGECSLVFVPGQKAILEQPVLCLYPIVGVNSSMILVVPKCSCPTLCNEIEVHVPCVKCYVHVHDAHLPEVLSTTLLSAILSLGHVCSILQIASDCLPPTCKHWLDQCHQWEEPRHKHEER